MKKLALAAAVVACASIVTAQTTSQNTVGYTKVTANGGELTLVALNFDAPTTLQDLIGDSVPGGSAVYKWDKQTSSYVLSSLSGRGAWGPNLALDIGDAFFIEPAGVGSHDIIIPGEVLAQNASIALASGVTATGYYFPVATPWQSTVMSGDLAGGAVLNVWNQGTQGYVQYSKSGRGSWSGNPTIAPAEAFFVENPVGPIVVDETIPWTP